MELGNGQVARNLDGYVRMRDARHSSSGIRRVASECVTAPKELADITTDVVVDDEGATRMIVREALDVEHKIVKYDELLTVGHALSEFLLGHDSIGELGILDL